MIPACNVSFIDVFLRPVTFHQTEVPGSILFPEQSQSQRKHEMMQTEEIIVTLHLKLGKDCTAQLPENGLIEHSPVNSWVCVGPFVN